MGNDESCCRQIDEKKGQIQSNINSLKYSSIIYNASNGNNKSNLKNTKNVFTGSKHLEDQIHEHQSKVSRKSSKISNQKQQKDLFNFHSSQSQSHFNIEKPNRSSLNQDIISEKSFSLHGQKIHSSKILNPEKAQLTKRDEINQQTLEYLKSQNASEKKYQNEYIQEKGSNSYQQSEIDDRLQRNQKPLIRMTKSAVQSQISIEYLPIVKKLIERERPFESQLQRIPKQKIKTRRANNGKDTYKGELNYYQKPHGHGVLVKENGNVLIGKFDNGSLNGLAFYILSNGSYYDGYMVDNKANDNKGEFHSLAMIYIGGFKDNLFHGEGKEIGKNYCFKGIYENHHKKHGILKWNSKYTDKKDNMMKIQKIQDKSDQGTKLPEASKFENNSDYDFEYEGNFDSNQQFTGKGRLKDPNGEYIGQFNQGKKHGQGTYLFDNKLRYIGQYKDNKKQGYGKLYNCDNTVAYEGFWKNNLPDGKGYSYGLDNKPIQLEFLQGISTLLAPEANSN